MCAQAERLVSKFEEMGAVTGDLGLSTLALAKFEDTDGSSCGTYTDSAMASKNISADTKRIGSVHCSAHASSVPTVSIFVFCVEHICCCIVCQQQMQTCSCTCCVG